jgi:colicin import membrane protein
MVAFRRREPEPDTSLTEARKELVHSYMDAEEAEARREDVERIERQSRMREQARLVAAEDKRREAEVRREDDEIARQVAAAVAEAREETRREAEEQAARQVAAAVEEAMRTAKDEITRQVAEAVAQARHEVVEEAARQEPVVEPASEPAREPEPEEPAPLVAATLGEARRHIPVKTFIQPAPEAARPESASAEATREETPPEPAQDVVDPEEQPAGHSTAGLPLSERIQAVTHPDAATARVDWTRELLRTKKKARTS